MDIDTSAVLDFCLFTNSGQGVYTPRTQGMARSCKHLASYPESISMDFQVCLHTPCSPCSGRAACLGRTSPTARCQRTTHQRQLRMHGFERSQGPSSALDTGYRSLSDRWSRLGATPLEDQSLPLYTIHSPPL